MALFGSQESVASVATELGGWPEWLPTIEMCTPPPMVNLSTPPPMFHPSHWRHLEGTPPATISPRSDVETPMSSPQAPQATQGMSSPQAPQAPQGMQRRLRNPSRLRDAFSRVYDNIVGTPEPDDLVLNRDRLNRDRVNPDQMDEDAPPPKRRSLFCREDPNL